MNDPSVLARKYSFGPFTLLPARQLLLEDDAPVRLGSRAREVLIALVERAGEVVSKDALVARLWPNVVVEEATLRVHVAALRKALGDGKEGRRYIVSIAGRGYSFVGAVTTDDASPSAARAQAGPAAPGEAPLSTVRLLGRTETVEALVADLAKHRLITVVGPGGIGKTAVALAVADRMRGLMADGARFIDLAAILDPQLVPSALASALGVGVMSTQPLPGLVAALRDREAVLVLDNCEHVIEEAAMLAEAIVTGAPRTRVLATSREPLSVGGEKVWRLPPLESPDSSHDLTAAEALTFPAVQLFVERAAARLDTFQLTDADAQAVADICRQLDGIALAIEISAGRVDAFGVAGLAAVLDDRFRLAMRGRRTALARHQTLSTALDWSYRLLQEHERAVLRRLAAFAGSFTIAAALAVVADADTAPHDVVESIASLVDKSLVAVDIDAPVATYRLLDTTRAYALQKLGEGGELATIRRRHARHFQALLEAALGEWEVLPAHQWVERHRHLVANVRAALDWSFAPEGDAAVGVALTIAAEPLWYQLSLVSECYERARRALTAAAESRDARQEMLLHAATAWSLMQIKGSVQGTQTAWATLLDLSRNLDEKEYQLRALWGLWAARLNAGAFRTSLVLAEEFSALALRYGTQLDRCVGDRMVGYSLHLLGDQAAARRYIERMLSSYVAPVSGAQMIRYVFDQQATALCFLARIQWLQGYPDQAMRTTRRVVEAARASGDALSLCQTLVQAACPVGLQVGDLPAVAQFVAELIEEAARNSWEFWHIWGQCFRGALLVRSGAVAAGMNMLDTAIGGLRSIEFGVYYIFFLGEYASALGLAGDPERGLVVIDQALTRSEHNEERWCVAELLRVRGELLRLKGDAAQAEAMFDQAREWTERQGALSWALRVATSKARLLTEQGRGAAARAELAAVCKRFAEGFDTADQRAARALLSEPSAGGASS
jgi:predicted ATPase/DNA-binding winged helix-turn-helix (wHTH) protein